MDHAPRHPLVRGERLYLRPLEPADVALTRQWLYESDYGAQTCRPLVLRINEPAGPEPGGPSAWAGAELLAVERSSGAPMGKVRYCDWNPRNRSAEIGYTIRPDQRGRGLGRESVSLLLDYLFHTAGLNKVSAQTGAFNLSSVALLAALGFQRDGILREHHFHAGRLQDDYLYSLLAREWRPCP